MTPEKMKKDKMLERVRGLLAKADSTEFPEEADSLREKADSLMTIYAIESFEIDMGRPAGEREKPEVRAYQYETGASDLDDVMPQIFMALAKLCRCKVGSYGWRESRVVGFSADLEYLDLLLTGVLLKISGDMDPRPKRDKTYGENLYVLKAAGLKWQKIYELMVLYFPEKFQQAKAPLTMLDYDQMGSYTRQGYIVVDGDLYVRKIPRNIGVRFTGEYKKHCEQYDLSRVMANPATYRRSFLEAFQMELIMRIHKMERNQEKETAGHGLVLSSRKGDILEAMYNEWPDKRPHPEDCDCVSCHMKKCKDETCQRSCCKRYRANRNKPIRYRREPERAFSSAAAQAGRSSAAKVDLSGGRNNLAGTKSLEG